MEMMDVEIFDIIKLQNLQISLKRIVYFVDMYWPQTEELAAPRPASVTSTHSGSNVSTKASSSRGKNDICVGEELKIAVNIALERFRLSEEQKG